MSEVEMTEGVFSTVQVERRGKGRYSYLARGDTRTKLTPRSWEWSIATAPQLLVYRVTDVASGDDGGSIPHDAGGGSYRPPPTG